MKDYEKPIVVVINFPYQDVICSSVSGEDNQNPWDDGWTRE